MTDILFHEAPTETIDDTPAELDVTTASELARIVGETDIRTMARHHVSLAFAVAELARAADRSLIWGPDDPTVSLLRALSNLAIDAPDAVSHEATVLRAALV